MGSKAAWPEQQPAGGSKQWRPAPANRLQNKTAMTLFGTGYACQNVIGYRERDRRENKMLNTLHSLLIDRASSDDINSLIIFSVMLAIVLIVTIALMTLRKQPAVLKALTVAVSAVAYAAAIGYCPLYMGIKVGYIYKYALNGIQIDFPLNSNMDYWMLGILIFASIVVVVTAITAVIVGIKSAVGRRSCGRHKESVSEVR